MSVAHMYVLLVLQGNKYSLKYLYLYICEFDIYIYMLGTTSYIIKEHYKNNVTVIL